MKQYVIQSADGVTGAFDTVDDAKEYAYANIPGDFTIHEMVGDENMLIENRVGVCVATSDSMCREMYGD